VHCGAARADQRGAGVVILSGVHVVVKCLGNRPGSV
jgi:hypothetical protein